MVCPLMSAHQVTVFFPDLIDFFAVVNFVVVVVVVRNPVVIIPNITNECPFPHWPPVLPPIFAILLSVLMVPAYCYSCGPWSGPYWADERKKLMMFQRHPNQQPRPVITVGHNDGSEGARLRQLTNGYGRL